MQIPLLGKGLSEAGDSAGCAGFSCPGWLLPLGLLNSPASSCEDKTKHSSGSTSEDTVVNTAQRDQVTLTSAMPGLTASV